MEDPKEVDDTLYIVDARPRQIGRMNVFREFVEQLEAQGKKVVVIDMPPSGFGGFRHIGVDSPRPPLLGATMANINGRSSLVDWKTSEMGSEIYFHPSKIPFAGETALDDLMRMDEQARWNLPFVQWADEPILPLPMTIKSFGEVIIPTKAVKKEKNKLGFLDGLGYKKRKYGNQK